ncbi:S41 family peptidase [Ekhidna sp.]|uniref:S41 family peptidase n=1 Tax=Ekhidna sp. TaxID=2608089 RepID=UPI003B5CB890
MRPLVLLLIAFCFSINTSFVPIKSGDSQDQLQDVDRLFYVAKIWGFLKYYHPLVAKGSYNWDEKLQNMIEKTAKYKTHAEFSNYIAKWVYYMGQLPPCRSCNNSNSDQHFLKNFDLSWTQDRRFSDEFRKTFKNIENNRFQGNHFYISQGDAQQFEPKNEGPDFDFIWKDPNQRLLPLFRYWNYIEYFYPHKYLTDQDWDDVLKEMIPKFLNADTELGFHLAMLELIVKIDDSHAGLVTSELDEMPYNNFLPARIDLIENQVVVTEIIDRSKAQMSDLKVGDVLKNINGRSAVSMHEANRKYIWGSNEAVKNRNIYHTLFMGMKEPPHVEIERNGSVRTATLNLYKYSDLSYQSNNSAEKWSIVDDSIGYADLGKVTNGDVDQMMSELINQQFIIFDLRSNPRVSYRALAKYLNPSDTVFAKFTRPDLSYPGKFIWDGERTCGEENEDYFKGNVVLLVDENTQSNAEFTCMSLQTAPNVTVVGSQTAGTLGNVSKFAILARLHTSMSAIGVYYPDGSETQRVGIVPDVNVKPTIAGIRADKDEVLDKAIQIAQEEIERLKEIARLEELARQRRLDSLARLDSLRVLDSLRIDSVRMNALPMDSLQMDSLKIDEGIDN